ncbi:hypothetical protein D3C80_1837470 [compost metagenome]
MYKAGRTNAHLRSAILLAVQTSANQSDICRGVYDNFDPEKIDTKLIDTFLDVHMANIMRVNGHYVLNDPIAYSSNQIPVIEAVKYA